MSALGTCFAKFAGSPACGNDAALAMRLRVESRKWISLRSFAQFFNPSRFAILGVVVEPEDRAQASSRFQATSSFAAIIGPPLGAPLLFTLGVQWALAINAASFAFSFGTIKAMRRPASWQVPC